MSTPFDLARACEEIAAQLRALDDHREQCERDLTKLAELGTIRASEHWRDGKYLYLIHPTDSCGQRKREYIGADPDKVANARAAMARERAADELRVTLKTIQEKTAAAWQYIGYAKSTIDTALATTGAHQAHAPVTMRPNALVTPGALSIGAGVTNQRDFW
ncbi:hypothetical protein [Aromatoleum evansii]|uniref:hypothetical protein n=1 Tax=Aromatoleum evansii TaxID=59406 RepID=UPI00145E08B1|nr:hypothetical protein [Aromatoleum evansii]NMG32605.1 hypothetical protein [Aromatoleum evansii]